jgi:hypothetical protein
MPAHSLEPGALGLCALQRQAVQVRDVLRRPQRADRDSGRLNRTVGSTRNWTGTAGSAGAQMAAVGPRPRIVERDPGKVRVTPKKRS